MIFIYELRDFFKGILIAMLILLGILLIVALLAFPMILALVFHWTFIFIYLIPFSILIELVRRTIVYGSICGDNYM